MRSLKNDTIQRGNSGRHFIKHLTGAPKNSKEKTTSYRDDQANFNTGEDDAGISADADNEIELIDLPEVNGGLVVDEAKHGRNDDGRKHHERSVVEQGSQEQERQHDRDRHDHVRYRRLAPGVVVHRRSRKWACKLCDFRWISILRMGVSVEMGVELGDNGIGGGSCAFTCGEIAREARADHVHGANGYHFFVAINVVMLEHREAPPNCYSFL